MTGAGLDLAARFYAEAVRPVLDRTYPGLPHAACLLGAGSEVLGYDDATSTDHDWGPRLQLLLAPRHHELHAAALDSQLARHLPSTFDGWSTRWAPPSPDAGAARPRASRADDPAAAAAPGGALAHRVEVLTVEGLLTRELGGWAAAVAAGSEPAPVDWLATPSHLLLGVTSGVVLHDDVGLAAARRRLAWYPDDVWRYLMAGGWSRIGQDEHLMPRAGQAGDDLGSRLVAADLARSVVRLALLQERRYPPYAKWLGTAFAALPAAATLGPLLAGALAAGGWQQRHELLGRALEVLAARHNALGLGAPVAERLAPFHDRPFQVVDGGAVARSLVAQITDPRVRALLVRRPVGGVDDVTTSTDVLADPAWRDRARDLWA